MHSSGSGKIQKTMYNPKSKNICKALWKIIKSNFNYEINLSDINIIEVNNEKYSKPHLYF